MGTLARWKLGEIGRFELFEPLAEVACICRSRSDESGQQTRSTRAPVLAGHGFDEMVEVTVDALKPVHRGQTHAKAFPCFPFHKVII